jgi:hypothetical protein
MSEEKKRLVTDIETLHGMFSVTFIDYSSDECWQYVIHKDKNELNLIKELLSKTQVLIGFNSIHFDSIVLHWMVNQKEVTAEKVYEVAQTIINQQDERGNNPYTKYKWRTPWINIDLFLYWSKMLRLSKKLSLKYFAVNLDMKIQEMPIHHSKEDFTDEEIVEVLDYNKNDVLVTKALCVKLREQINLRLGINKQYGLDAYSWDAPKIASELLLDSFCQKTYKNLIQNDDDPEGFIPFWEYKKQIRNKRTDSYSYKTGDYLPVINFKTPVFQELYKDMCNHFYDHTKKGKKGQPKNKKKDKAGFSKEVIYKRFDSTFLKISYGAGGIHSVNKNESYFSNDRTDVWTSDAESLYPNLLINYKYIRKEIYEMLEIYTETKVNRVKAKKEGNKVVNETLKLVLNSTTGLLDNEYSWLYSSPEVMGLRLTGQLILTRLMEECNLHNFLVISLNTDGIEVIITKGREEEYLALVKGIEQEFNLIFEHEKYKAIHYKSVNDYLAITQSGKLKTKGEFIYDKILDGSNEFLIISIAVKEYFVKGIPIEQTIMEHKNIYDFCTAKKISKDYTIWYMEEQQQQLNRFFCSKRGGYLYKKKKHKLKPTMEHIFGESGVILLNDITTLTPQELDVDFNFYINAARDRIKLFEKEQLNMF